MAMYLGTQKITPALVEEKQVIKLGKPKIILDYDRDLLAIAPNPVPVLAKDSRLKLFLNDSLLASEACSANSVSVNTSYGTYYYHEYKFSSFLIHNLNTLPIGVNHIKANQVNGQFSNASLNGEVFELPSVNISDSDFSDEVIYEKWNYTNILTDLSTDSLNGSLNNRKYNEGIINTYKKSIVYNFNLNPGNATKENAPTITYSTLKMSKNGDSLYTIGALMCSSFAKVSFTLTEDTEVKVKYLITKSNSTTPTILICPIDRNYTTFSYYSKLSNPVVSYNTSNDFEEKEYSFGTLSAGEHFYFVQFYDYASYNGWHASITPYFEKIELGKNLPANITVTYNRNYEGHPDAEEKPVADYEYDPYTGKFKIPMVGNISMTAVGSSNVILDKLAVTPATWDTYNSVLTWDYSVSGFTPTYHIQTPDGNEYTTTEKSFDFTGKLGEPSSDFEDYKLVKIWAETSNNQSGKTYLKLLYNPQLNQPNMKYQNFVSDETSGKYNIMQKDGYLYILISASGKITIRKYDIETKALIKTIDVGTISNFKFASFIESNLSDRVLIILADTNLKYTGYEFRFGNDLCIEKFSSKDLNFSTDINNKSILNTIYYVYEEDGVPTEFLIYQSKISPTTLTRLELPNTTRTSEELGNLTEMNIAENRAYFYLYDESTNTINLNYTSIFPENYSINKDLGYFNSVKYKSIIRTNDYFDIQRIHVWKTIGNTIYIISDNLTNYHIYKITNDIVEKKINIPSILDDIIYNLINDKFVYIYDEGPRSTVLINNSLVTSVSISINKFKNTTTIYNNKIYFNSNNYIGEIFL